MGEVYGGYDMEVQLVSCTPEPEKIVLYCARVSNPRNQDSGSPKLIKYLIENKHWSPFEMSDFTFEVKTSRAIQEQLVRHWSMRFQIFSQRYSKVDTYEVYPPRLQDTKNRQSSLPTDDEELIQWFITAQHEVNNVTHSYYKQALEKGIAKDHARFLLTMGSSTTLYMHGSLRSWIHFLDARDHEHAQWQTQEIAKAIKNILIDLVPYTAQALGWIE